MGSMGLVYLPTFINIYLGLSPLPVTVANEGLGWDPLLKTKKLPGGDCYWVGGRPNIYH